MRNAHKINISCYDYNWLVIHTYFMLGHCARCWGHSREQNKDPSLNGTDIPEGERVKPFKA